MTLFSRIRIFRSKGILPQALINYITFGGGGFALDRENNSKSYSMQELAEMVILIVRSSLTNKY